jgi:hypothetical protein
LAFAHMYEQYLYYIHPPSHVRHLCPHPTVINPPLQDLFYSPLL